MSVGDINSTAKGSGARYNDGKPDLSLIPIATLEDEARVWMYGAKKYSRNNWQKGMAWSVPLASLLRHLSAWQAGEDNDPETGLPHLAHISCNVRMLSLYSKTYKEGDDRFKGPDMKQPEEPQVKTVTFPPEVLATAQPFTGDPPPLVAVASPALEPITPAIPLAEDWGNNLSLPS